MSRCECYNALVIRSIQRNSRLLPFLLISLLVMQILDPSRVWSILIAGLGGAWLVSYLWIRSLASGLRIKREVRFGWAQVGDRLEERFTVTNTAPVPALWFEVDDHSELPGYRINRATGVEQHSYNQWRTQGLCTQRGLFRLGPTSLYTSDPFGIYTLTVHNPASTSLVVMPPVVDLPLIQVAPGGRSGEAPPRHNAPDRTVSSGGVREYEPGDSLRYIHWRTSARLDQFYVQLFDGTPAGDWWIVLDLDANVQVGEGWDATEEHGIILAASLADHGLRLRRAVGLIASGRDLIWLPTRSDQNQRWDILRGLAAAKPGEMPLGRVLERLRPAIKGQTSLVIITPNVQGEWIKSLISLVWRGTSPTVLLLDPRTFGSKTQPTQTVELLTQLGITHYMISRDLLDRPEARPGQEGKWEWKVSATGRALPIKMPSDLSWKVLS